jgi:molybdate transport system ATP-binding protein
LVQTPDWLLLDEFYNGLDGDYRARIDRVLERACAHGGAWIVAAHRASDIPSGARGLIELRAGRLHSMRPMRATERRELARTALERPHPHGPKKCRLARARLKGARAPLMSLRGVNLFLDYRAVLKGLDWDVFDGEHWAIFGANGAGKTSLLKLLYGDLSPAHGGRIERRGFPPGTPIADWKRQVGYVSPELQADYAIDITLEDLIASGRHASIGLVDAPNGADRRAAWRWLRFFKLVSVAKKRPRELSYGQLRRALFARALAARARVLLLDEPLTGLDPRQRALMKRLLARLMGGKTTVIIAGHHPEDLPRGITHSLRLEQKRAYFTDCHGTR